MTNHLYYGVNLEGLRDSAPIPEVQEIVVNPVELHWSQWTRWADVAAAVRRGGVALPTEKGVYEVRRADTDERLTIGKASNLRFRVKQALVRVGGLHSSGIRIRAAEDLDKLVIRWAGTSRPAAVEEELHRLHFARFGHLPTYTQHT